jgi:hypothetical protein
MEENKKEVKKLSMSNTKQEMLETYRLLLKQLQEKEPAELKPEKIAEEKKSREVVQVAESLNSEGVARQIGQLKIDIGRMLSQVSDRMEEEVNRFISVQQAVSAREKELQEIYEIERMALTFSALIEAQNSKRLEFEKEMALKKEILQREIDTTREEWEKEQESHDAAVKERDSAEKKRQTREKEEFDYAFTREQQVAKDRFEYERGRLEDELKTKRDQMEKELKTREAAIAESEGELEDLRKKAIQFPKELETAVARAVKEVSDRLVSEAKSREALLLKEFEGERNVLNTRIESLEEVLKEQSERTLRLSQQLEAAYQKVQDIAVKTVEGATSFKSVSNLQQLLGEQMKKQVPEK